jgi:hypothetical protein
MRRQTIRTGRGSSLVVALLLGACGSSAGSPPATTAAAPSQAVSTSSPVPTAAQLVAIGPSGTVVMIAATQAPATPTPGIGPGADYRMEGVVVDGSGAPLVNVCIVIGPNGCRDHSPHTDARGVYFIDFPAGEVDYDLHFIKAGYIEFDQRVKPTRNTVLNVVLGAGAPASSAP